MFNPNSDGVNVTLEVHSEKGNLTGKSSFILPGGNRVSKTLPQLVPEITDQMRGFIRISSEGGPIVVFELFGDQSLQFLATVPPQSITP